MERRIFIESWQWACCGSPFAVGQTVTWSASPRFDREWLGKFIGPEVAAEITHFEDHHDMAEGSLEHVTGTVSSITAAFCRFTSDRPPDTRSPVPGTAVFEPRSRVDGSEPQNQLGDFQGYVVTLM